jgi:hypothetical protein
MATKKTATSQVHANNVVPQQNQTTNTPAAAPPAPNAWCSGICWITAFGNTSSPTYQNCMSQCMGQGQIAPTGPVPDPNNTTLPNQGGGQALPIGNPGALQQISQDAFIRIGLGLAGAILILFGIVKLFSGNKAINVTLQPPERRHTFGGAPPPPPPSPAPKPALKPLPPMRIQSGPPSTPINQPGHRR